MITNNIQRIIIASSSFLSIFSWVYIINIKSLIIKKMREERGEKI
jgi:hypothetical protein